jgi:hypothetical protein
MSDDGPAADPQERQNRELIEFLNELRVVLPGVQVLFAFLLTLPFTQRFESIDGTERATYVVSFAFTTLSAILLMTPATWHRIRFRKQDKETMLRVTNQFALAGLVSLAVAVVAAVGLVAEVVLSLGWASAAAIASGVLIALLWFAIPLYRNLQDDREGERG